MARDLIRRDLAPRCLSRGPALRLMAVPMNLAAALEGPEMEILQSSSRGAQYVALAPSRQLRFWALDLVAPQDPAKSLII